MSNKVDKLFKDKLEGHSLRPSAQAWEKVEAHLSKKNRMVLWSRVAAAVALVGLFTYAALSWTNDYEEPKQELVKEEGKGTPKVEPVQEDRIKKSEVRSKEQVARNKKAETGNQELKTRNSEHRTPNAERRTLNSEPNTQNAEPRTEEPVGQIAVIQEPIVTSQPEIKKEKGITLTYNLPAIKKSEATAEPMVAEAKKTGLERVLEIAKEVKNGDNPLGELREAKNDILALEFRKDRNKTKKE